MSLFVFFISLLIVAQHVSGNHVPIIRSWRLRDFIASCWYVPWLQGGCQVRLVGSASMEGFVAPHIRFTPFHIDSARWAQKWRYTYALFFFIVALRPHAVHGLLIHEVSISHTRRITVGRTSRDEWSARHRDLYLTTHNTYNRQTSMPPGGIRTHDLSRRAAADLRPRPGGHGDPRTHR